MKGLPRDWVIDDVRQRVAGQRWFLVSSESRRSWGARLRWIRLKVRTLIAGVVPGDCWIEIGTTPLCGSPRVRMDHAAEF